MSGEKGFLLEELLRNYFLKRGSYVIRGVPLRLKDEDVTDIDLWIYDKATGTARRRQIVDIKSTNKPRAFERVFWTKGLVDLLKVDGAYIATKDQREALRETTKDLNLFLLDGQDIKRIEANKENFVMERYAEEDLTAFLKDVDSSRQDKLFKTVYDDVKSSVLHGFGASTLVRALEGFKFFSEQSVSSYSNSPASIVSGRLAYFCASIVAIALDFLALEKPFCTEKERMEKFINSVRYGNADSQLGLKDVRVALSLVRQYAENGSATAYSIETAIKKAYDAIPAEIVAEQANRMADGSSMLFSAAKYLENACYAIKTPIFDELDTRIKAFVGSLLDFSSVDRACFAGAWSSQGYVPNEKKLSVIAETW